MCDEAFEYLFRGARLYEIELAVASRIEECKIFGSIVTPELYLMHEISHFNTQKCIDGLLNFIPENIFDETISSYGILFDDDSSVAIPPFLKLVKEERETRKASTKSKIKN